MTDRQPADWIDRREIYHYLGYRGEKLDSVGERMERIVEEAIAEAAAVYAPRICLRKVSVRIEEETNVFLDAVCVPSRDLAKNLRFCESAVLMAVTIGIGVDRLIRRAELTNLVKATALNAVGSAAVEACCDEVNEKISQEAKDKGLRTRPRFSPGYGDYALDRQGDFLQMLGGPKETGIHLTDGNLMIPMKSVTAVIGLYKEEKKCN